MEGEQRVRKGRVLFQTATLAWRPFFEIFLIATVSPSAMLLAFTTTPNRPLPISAARTLPHETVKNPSDAD
jgi:hypothetical protein